MAKVKKILLNNFRNFENLEISFEKKSNIFFGKNGSGKTNILEAISLIDKGKGLRNSQIINMINNNKNFLINSLVDIKDNDYDVNIYSKQKDAMFNKFISVNDDSSRESINFLYSSITFLFFLPEMERLFQSSPSNRRNFIDRLIYTRDNQYNKLVNKYKKKLMERSKIILGSNIDESWISIIEKEISQIGLKIYYLRDIQIQDINKQIILLNNLSNYSFNINLKVKDKFYSQDITQDIYQTELFNSRQIDRKFGGTNIGPHKSDIIAEINNEYDASQLSTGQQKTVVLMILLAQCKYLVDIKKIRPIVLLDEICSHLDSDNRKILLDMINDFDIQFFLTGTEKTLFSFISTNVKFYNITS